MFRAELLIIAKKWKQRQMSINFLIYLYKYYLAIKKDEVLIHTPMWMDLETLYLVK